jgi:hypothetical protein
VSTARVVRTSPLAWIALLVLLSSAWASQVALDGAFPRNIVLQEVHWIRSSDLMRRLTVGFNTIWADVYWIRAVQYYGDNKLAEGQNKDYSLLYPLLDTTTTLDPRFNIAYRFGAILLSEGYPNGPGDTDQAIRLLEKGMREMPEKWQYLYDAGFVNYWWRRDSKAASHWFMKAAAIPGAPNWLQPLAASVLAEGGQYDNAREMWAQILINTDQEWLKDAARRGLMQLDAETHIELLQEKVVNPFYEEYGRFPASWMELVQLGKIRRIPLDPTGKSYTLDPISGAISVGKNSSLFPMPSRARG